MKNWNLGSQDPGAYTIAADARCGVTDYTNDHIWELRFSEGDPPALAIQTNFGLRAKNLRLFPRFAEGDTAIIDPAAFNKPPTVHRFYPNYIFVSFAPFEGIDVKIEYWVPDSIILAGRIRITNSRLISRNIRVQLAALLLPSDEGQRMAHYEMEATTILKGQTGSIFPVIFMTGGPELSAGPYPALSIAMDLAPGAMRELNWVQVADDTPDKSFQKARKTAARKWDPEIARLDVLNQGLVEIITGDKEWDAAFALSQKCALGLLVGPTQHLPNLSCVSSRLPHQGFSSLGNGSDYDHLWNGQTPLDVYHLSKILLPGFPHLVTGLLRNFLETQTQSGFIEFKPGLAGQRQRIMATPILVDLAWQIYDSTEDIDFLINIFHQLNDYVNAWFNYLQDRDGDGIPEWARPSQSGFEDHPVFSHVNPWAQGGDISKIESPSLCAFLYNEIQRLKEISEVIKQSGSHTGLDALADNLLSALEASWDDLDGIYRNWDRESHFSPNGESLGHLVGPGTILINREFSYPVRISVRLIAKAEIPNSFKAFIHGISASGNYRIESILLDQFRWHAFQGYGSSEQIYKQIENIEVIGLQPEDQIVFEVLDLSMMDHTQLLPLWAGIPDDNKARKMIEKTVTNPGLFWKPFGLMACPYEATDENHPCQSVHLIWNNFIGEGLIRYGYRQEAADLVSRIMKGIISNLKTNKSFYNYYHAITGRGQGERNVLSGLFPVKLFLEVLGVRIISPSKVYITGKNPFPWTVTLRYQELIIKREFHRTKITFPGGQSAIIKNNNPRLITVE